MNKHFSTLLEIEPRRESRQGIMMQYVSSVSISTDNEELHDALVAAVLAVEESRKNPA